jgi:heme/copper-type cytochrome/quinol oxidase subunit 4
MAVRRTKFHQFTLRALGGVGYFTLFMEWFWLFALYLPGMLESEFSKAILPTSKTPLPQPVHAVQPPAEPSGIMIFSIMVLAVALLGTVLYLVFVKYIPTAANATTKVVHGAAKKAVPIIAHKPVDKISVRKRRILTERIVFWLKICLAVIPFAIVYMTHHRSGTTVSLLVIMAMAVLTLVALVCSTLQVVLAKRWRISLAGAAE